MAGEQHTFKVGEKLKVQATGLGRWNKAHDRVVTVTALDEGRVQLWWARRWGWYRINRSGSLSEEVRWSPEVLIVKGPAPAQEEG